MKSFTSFIMMVLACLFVIFQMAQCNPLAEANAEADPFFLGLLGGGRGGFGGRGGYGGYGGYGGGYGREGGGFGRRHGFGYGR